MLSPLLRTAFRIAKSILTAICAADIHFVYYHVINRSRSRTSRHTRELQKRLNTARTALAKIRKAEQSSD
jgi:hypothetical protein